MLSGFHWRTEHTVGAVLLLALCLPVTIYFTAFHEADLLRGSIGSVMHSQDLMLGMDQVALDMANAQHQQYFDLADPSPAAHASVMRQIAAAQQQLAKLKQLAAGDAPVEARIAALAAAVQAQAQDLEHSLLLAGHPQQAQAWLTSPAPRAHQEAVRRLAAAGVKAETDTLAYWKGVAAQFQTRWRGYFAVACLIGLILLLSVFALAVREIRKRRRAQQALALSHEQLAQSWERYHSLIANVPAAVWTVAPGSGIEFVSAQIETLTGYTVSELMSAGPEFWREHVAPEDWPAVVAAFTPPTGDGRPGRLGCEFRFQQKSGAWVWLQALGQFVTSGLEGGLDGHDGHLRADGVVYDVTEAKRSAENELQRRELEFRDAEMQRAYRIKNDFLAAVSHELRTPLSAILGFSDLLEQEVGGALNPEQRDFAHHIHRSGELLLALINDILDLSRLEAGAMPVHLEAFALHEAVDDAVSTVARLAQEKQIRIESRPAAGLTVWADPLRCRQILLNLLNNAVKFTPAGGSVSTSATVSADGTAACIRVRDTGIGIPAEDLGVIFDRFRQLGRRDHNHPGGAGLGLAIAKHLAERQGGSITVESTVGEGSVFEVRIPLALAHQPNYEETHA